MPDAPEDPLIGSIIDDRYLVHSKVADGGMGTVYLATHLRLNRLVALKVLRYHLAADPEFVERFQGEAHAAARLSHPHVVSVYDQGEENGTAYLVMEYVAGQTLRDVLDARGALTPREALDLLDPVVDGLAAAHAAGLVHRDVKPENVLISSEGRVKVADFGLSRAVTTTTRTITRLGTAEYTAPELLNGLPADARSDIYSAGIMLYEMLTGHRPFPRENDIQVAVAHVTTDVPRPSLAVPGLAADLDELVLGMTERDPDLRPSDGSALLEDLRYIRHNLSDAQLDHRPQARVPAAASADAAEAATTALPAPPSGATALATSAQETTALPAGATTALPLNATTALPARHNLYPSTDDADLLDKPDLPDAAYDGEGDGRPGLTKRQQRSARKEEARNAGTPTRTLQRGNPRRRGLIWFIVVLVLAVLVALAGWFFGLGPGALATVPNVADKTVSQARADLAAAGFTNTSTDAVFDEKIAQGLVVRSDPAAQSAIRRFQRVVILISKGPVLYPVPDLAGRGGDDARAALAQAHLSVGTVAQSYGEKAPAGTVLGQDPVAGTQLRGGSAVNLVVSKGPRPIPVPPVVGKTKDAALRALADAGLTGVVDPQKVNDKTVPAGSIVSQSPDSGTLTAGGKVTLTVSKGPRMVHVPSFVGKQVSVAKAALEELGFTVKVQNLLGGFFGTVRFQDPKDEDAPEGSTVTLQVI